MQYKLRYLRRRILNWQFFNLLNEQFRGHTYSKSCIEYESSNFQRLLSFEKLLRSLIDRAVFWCFPANYHSKSVFLSINTFSQNNSCNWLIDLEYETASIKHRLLIFFLKPGAVNLIFPPSQTKCQNERKFLLHVFLKISVSKEIKGKFGVELKPKQCHFFEIIQKYARKPKLLSKHMLLKNVTNLNPHESTGFIQVLDRILAIVHSKVVS